MTLGLSDCPALVRVFSPPTDPHWRSHSTRSDLPAILALFLSVDQGNYADDCLVQRVTVSKCYIVATVRVASSYMDPNILRRELTIVFSSLLCALLFSAIGISDVESGRCLEFR